jgi:hypothetical protein
LSITVSSLDVVVTTPSNNISVTSPFSLQAQSSSCRGIATSSMSYALDGGADTTFNGANALNLTISASAGPHVVHVKSRIPSSTAACQTDANITVVGQDIVLTTPTGPNVGAPFPLQATATTCANQSTASMAYSLDSDADQVFSGATSINASVLTATGAHILRVKAWNGSGTLCEKDTDVNVVNNSLDAPSSAILKDLDIELHDNYTGRYALCGGGIDHPLKDKWQTQIDCGTKHYQNITNAATEWVSQPPGHDTDSHNVVRRYHFNYPASSKGAGVRWFDLLGSSLQGETPGDTTSTHFIYDVYVYFNSVKSTIGNLEMDFNQAFNSGGIQKLYIYGVQCWLVRTGGARWQIAQPGTWADTNQSCPDQNGWKTGMWHHIRIKYHRGPNVGDLITYDAVALDGNFKPLLCPDSQHPCTSPPRNAAWDDGTIGPNFQLDAGDDLGGLVEAFADDFKITRW